MPYIEDQLKELPPDPLALPGDFFRRLVRRLEYVKPVQKKEKPLITVKPLPGGNGHVIDLEGGKVTVTVCENGVPVQYELIGRKKES